MIASKAVQLYGAVQRARLKKRKEENRLPRGAVFHLKTLSLWTFVRSNSQKSSSALFVPRRICRNPSAEVDAEGVIASKAVHGYGGVEDTVRERARLKSAKKKTAPEGAVFHLKRPTLWTYIRSNSQISSSALFVPRRICRNPSITEGAIDQDHIGVGDAARPLQQH